MNPHDELTPSVDQQNTMSSSRADRVPSRYRYGGWALISLIGLELLLIWLFAADIVGSQSVTDQSDIAVYALVIMSWGVLLVDWHGYTSFNGRVRWEAISGSKKFWLVCAFVLAPEFTLAAYLWFAAQDHLAAIGSTLRQQLRIQWDRFNAASIGIKVAISTALVVVVFAIAGLSGASYAHGKSGYVALVAPSPTARSATVKAVVTVTPTPTPASPTPTTPPLPTATPSPTPAPTATPAPSGPPKVGGTLADFTAQYGQPIHTTGTGTVTFAGDSAQTIFIGVDLTNEMATKVSVSADSSWDDVQTYNYCYQFVPSDASLFNNDGQIYDYNTSIGEVILDNLGGGQCMIYEA